jgi:hypothetical protein
MTEVLVDGNSLFARCWFAVKGDADAALRVCVNSVLQLLDQIDGKFNQPVHRTLFGWDGKSKTEKHRDPKPRFYLDTRYRFQEVLLALFNTVHGFHESYEADDIIATACFNSKADQIFVVSGDKDLMQLQGGNVFYYCLNTKGILSPRTICHKFGIKKPNQVALALAILGDRGDNISGIPRWGPKKVQTLFEAVTDQMDFLEAMQAIQLQIPQGELMNFFMASLDKTLLHTDVPGVPEPGDLVFCSREELNQVGIEGISQGYQRVAMQYDGGEAALDEMIKRRQATSQVQKRNGSA